MTKAIMVILIIKQGYGMTSQPIEFQTMLDCRIAVLGLANELEDGPFITGFCVEVPE
jgi:hypothetical protein